MPSFLDSGVIVVLALLLFGPKKLPVLARQLGKLMADFRRASNEFRSQMEEELRISEQAERQKQIAAIEAAAPNTPAIGETSTSSETTPAAESDSDSAQIPPPEPTIASPSEPEAPATETTVEDVEYAAHEPSAPVPIATSGELSIMPPSTGLPIPNTPATSADPSTHDPLPAHEAELEIETLHG